MLFSPSVAKAPYSSVVKLQTMTCLFEAYEHVLSLLERVFTPMFCHSDEVRQQKSKTNICRSLMKVLDIFVLL